MNIQLIRIDDRLIHGQVVVGWVKALDIQRLVVVNDEITKNNMRRTLMEMAVPADLKVSFLGISEAVSASKSSSPERSLLLFASPADVLAFVKAGGAVSAVNVGGMHFSEGKNQITKTICVDSNDLAVFKELKKMGVEMEIRAVPGDARENLEKAIPEIKD
jgi:mannose/fructose/sorbose-specific phosphotransferase system IIB component